MLLFVMLVQITLLIPQKNQRKINFKWTLIHGDVWEKPLAKNNQCRFFNDPASNLGQNKNAFTIWLGAKNKRENK